MIMLPRMKVRASLRFLLLLTAVTLVSGCQKEKAKQPTPPAKTQTQKAVAAPADKAGTAAPDKAKIAGAKTQAASTISKTKSVAAVAPEAPEIEAPRPAGAKTNQFKIVHSSNLQGEVEPCG